MTVRARPAALLSLLGLFIAGSPLALSQEASPAPSLRLAQKADEPETPAEKKLRELEQLKQKALKKKQDAEKARQDADKKKQLDAEQAKQKALQKKQEADKARQDALKKKQLQLEQAKQKALQQKQDAEKARQDALKKNQLQIEQAKKKALQQKQEAEAAAKKKQLEAEQAKQKALKKSPGPAPKFDRAKTDQEFEKARQKARQPGASAARPADTEKWREGSAKKFETVRKQRKERVDATGSRNLIIEPDKRVIVRQQNRAFIRHDDSRRLKKSGRELRRERRKDGTTLIVTLGLAGALIYTLQDDHGHLLRRSRKGKDGREFVLFDNRRFYRNRPLSPFGPRPYSYDSYISLPPPVVRIPREQYIVEYERASPDDLYDALRAPPVEELERGYSLDEVLYNYDVLQRMRRIDLDAITFEFGSWDVGEDQFPKLERIAAAIRRILQESPDEVFLIEGHTDAVGSDVDNLSLSDRRAETVAVILTEEFDIPAENLMTQGFGEQHLKVLTEEPSRINRRVSVRRITPLLAREGSDEPY